MNTEMIPEEVDPEIDMRLTAMVLGEASDFEKAQLHELMSQRPELASWYKQLQHLHGELHQWAWLEQCREDAVSGERLHEAEPWMLSPEKRASVLAVLGRGEVEMSQKVSRLPLWQKLSNSRPKRRGLWMAASVVAGFVLICSALMLPSLQSARMQRTWRDVAIAPKRYRDAAPAAASTPPSTELPSAYYLQDDVQYFPQSIERKSSLESAQKGDSGQDRVAGRYASPSNSATFGNELPTIQRPSGPPTDSPASNASTSLPSTGLPSTSSPSSGGKTSLYAMPNPANDSDKTVTPRFDIADESKEMPQVTVPGGGGMFLGGVAVEPTLPPAPAVTGAPSVGSGKADAENWFGRTTEPADKSLGLAAGELSEGKLAETETLKRQVEFSKPELAGEQADREALSAEVAEPQESRLNRRGEPSLEQRFGSKESNVALGYFDAEANGNAPAKPGSPMPSETLDDVLSLGERKPQSETTIDDPFADDVPAKKKSETVAPEEQSLALEKSLSEHDFGMMPEMNQNGFGGGGMGGMGGRGGMRGGRSSERYRQNSEVQRESSEWLLEESATVLNAKNTWDKANKDGVSGIEGMNRDMALMDAKEGRKDVRQDALDEGIIAGKKLNLRRQLQEKAKSSPGLNETLTEAERFSTFSLHVSDVSFKLALDSLAKGQWPEAAKIRLEEFLNAFDYQDPLPSDEEKVACRVEQAVHPFLMQRNVLRVAMRTSAVGRNGATPLRLALLLDNSGSMQRVDRAQTVRRAFETLAQQLTPADEVTLITFANEPKLRADRVKGSEILSFVNILENSPVEGGTNLESALRLALEKAKESKTPGAQSRVILMTDGAVNLGDADPSNLSQWVLKMREQGIAFDAAGISAQDLNDEVLEALTRQGDGRYYLLDNAEQVDAGFAQQIAGALRPSAKNVKIQVEFNPQRVRSYKLLGFEKHILNKEDFRNDKVDAAELASAEAGVALYHYEMLPEGVGDVGSVSVRFQDMTTGMMIEKRWPIAYEPSTSRLDQAQSSLKLATSSVLFAAHLKGEPLGENVDLKVIAEILGSLGSPYSNMERVQQLRQMVESARQIAGASSGNR